MGTTEVINCDFMEAQSVNMDNSSAEYLPGCLLVAILAERRYLGL